MEIEIDGKKIEANPGEMLIQAADRAGITIPRFCYHNKLSVAANCRMCLVEVEKSGKPLPACATPVMEGMNVKTQSAMALAAQRSVMEFLLINHPLDCPICDQGGECELQDLSMGYGEGISKYSRGKRSVHDTDLGPLISTEMTRCIHCTRCVRFGEEIAGLRELGVTHRGEDSEIGTYVEKSLVSEVSGNIIDLCPVGALTSKPFRFQARAWEMQQHASIAPHDCIGSNIHVHTRAGELMRVVPKANESVNECWLSDRDRFSYLGVFSEDRLTQPMIRENGHLVPTDWETALRVAVDGLQKVVRDHGADQIAAIGSPNATLEEHYLLQKVFRGLGSNHVDHRLRECDVADQQTAPLFPGMNFPLHDLENYDRILLIGSNIRMEQPIAGLKVRKAACAGAEVLCVNPVDYDFHFPVAQKIIAHPAVLSSHLAGIAKALITKEANLPAEAVNYLKPYKTSVEEQTLVDSLQSGEKVAVILGALAFQHPQASMIRSMARIIAQATGGHLGYFTEGANSAGAWLAGCVPHRLPGGDVCQNPGLSVQEAIAKQLPAYLFLDVEPEYDMPNPQATVAALRNAECVVALSPYQQGALLRHAHVILPITSFVENAGTHVNVEGIWQSFTASIKPYAQSRPAWKVLRVLGNLLGLDGFDYVASVDVQHEVKTLMNDPEMDPFAAWYAPEKIAKPSKPEMVRFAPWPIYAIDSLVRRAQPLQASAANPQVGIRLHSDLAKRLQLDAGDEATAIQASHEVRLPVIIDDRVPDHVVYVASGCEETLALGAGFDPIDIRK